MIFSFSHSQYLFLLFILPLFFLIHFLSINNRKKGALKFANFEAIAKIEGVDFFSKNIILLILNLLIILSLVFAISGLTLHPIRESSSFSFVIAIDSSQSMQADDLPPDRLTVSKQVAKDFVDTIPYGLDMGVISFSGSSYIEQDMTEDRSEIKNAIENIELSTFGGTDLYEVVITSTNLLKNKEERAIILLSDGQINVGTVDEVIDYARDNDVIIHTVAIGTKEGGTTDYAISKLDEDSLQSIAYMTGGNYFTAETEEAFAEAFANVLTLTKKKVSVKFSNYLLLFAIALLILKFFLTNTKYFHLP